MRKSYAVKTCSEIPMYITSPRIGTHYSAGHNALIKPRLCFDTTARANTSCHELKDWNIPTKLPSKSFNSSPWACSNTRLTRGAKALFNVQGWSVDLPGTRQGGAVKPSIVLLASSIFHPSKGTVGLAAARPLARICFIKEPSSILAQVSEQPALPSRRSCWKLYRCPKSVLRTYWRLSSILSET
jgi:hypothetical protein